MPGTVRALYVMSGGWCSVERSFLTAGVGAGERIRVPIPIALVDTRDGWVLFDTGMNCEGIHDPEGTWGERAKIIQPRLVPEDDVRYRLGEVGVHLEDIRVVVNSHLHWDHCGGNRLFRHCPIVAQRAEMAFAREPTGLVAGGYMANHFDLPLKYDLIEGDQEIAPGVRTITTHGHTPGHQSLLVDLESGRRVALCADAAYTYATLEQRLLSDNVWDRGATGRSLDRLRGLGAEGALLVPGHEPSLWESLGPAPVRLT
jgi:N-acyl homoserine lactone hydrolase